MSKLTYKKIFFKAAARIKKEAEVFKTIQDETYTEEDFKYIVHSFLNVDLTAHPEGKFPLVAEIQQMAKERNTFIA